MTKVKLETLLNEKLYDAATKAGMVEELNRIRVSVYVSERNGKRVACVEWEHELAADDDDFIFPTEAFMNRVETCVAKLFVRFAS